MGNAITSGNSKLERTLGGELSEPYFGLENFGNTCYCNSVLQALYFCIPFRDKVLSYYSRLPKDAEENLLTCLGDLFMQISTQKRRTGVVAPRRFVNRLKKDNELFRSLMHQDAHEFLNWLLNTCCDILEKEALAALPPPPPGQPPPPPPRTFIHELFQGTLENQTRCLWCETVTSRDESFLDLSLDIDQNSSITACLRSFSSVETLANNEKFFCDACAGLQEAQKRMLVKAPPPVLALHLKRFKYIEKLQRYKKLLHRVVFPNELRLCNATEGAPGGEDAYHLFAVVVHVGSGPNQGHYVSVVSSGGRWLSFDDESVEPVSEEARPMPPPSVRALASQAKSRSRACNRYWSRAGSGG